MKVQVSLSWGNMALARKELETQFENLAVLEKDPRGSKVLAM